MLPFIKIGIPIKTCCNNCLNTPHVSVHRICRIGFLGIFLVSIHLMLAFIIFCDFFKGSCCVFQYISCYRSSNEFLRFSYNTISCFSPICQPILYFLPAIFIFLSHHFISYFNPCITTFLLIYKAKTAGKIRHYINKFSPVSCSFFPNTSSPKTLSFINFIMQTKSSCSFNTVLNSLFNCTNFEGVISPRKNTILKILNLRIVVVPFYNLVWYNNSSST